MTNTTHEVWKILMQNPAIQRNLSLGLINTRALAKYIIKKYMLKASVDSVISAIRRFDIDTVYEEPYEVIANLFDGSSISTRSNIACVKLKKKPDIVRYLSMITKLTNFDEKEYLRLIKGRRLLKVVIDEQQLDSFLETFDDKDIIEVNRGYTEIGIEVSPRADQTKGVISIITNEILASNVNICEFICCVPDILIYVENKDALSAHESIMRICNKRLS